eukprot:2075852-Pleurochrysis_carterae.AAC.1
MGDADAICERSNRLPSLNPPCPSTHLRLSCLPFFAADAKHEARAHDAPARSAAARAAPVHSPPFWPTARSHGSWQAALRGSPPFAAAAQGRRSAPAGCRTVRPRPHSYTRTTLNFGIRCVPRRTSTASADRTWGLPSRRRRRRRCRRAQQGPRRQAGRGPRRQAGRRRRAHRARACTRRCRLQREAHAATPPHTPPCRCETEAERQARTQPNKERAEACGID